MRAAPAWSTEDAIVTPKLGEVQLSADERRTTGGARADRRLEPRAAMAGPLSCDSL